jgi:tRNA-uridine 2-sulfurtransferase
MSATNKKKKVLIALSGGIDSAVSAYLLQQQGYEVEAAFMKNWSSTKGLKYDECPWLTDRQDALRVAGFLRIPMHTLDFEKQYAKNVLNYFFREYSAGRTPNPDVMCNKEIKFKLLYDWAMARGFDYIATGHYARVENIEYRIKHREKRKESGSKNQGVFSLARSKDEFKDQTYFIYNIRTEQLPHILFPIGNMLKKDVRALARKVSLPNANKKESMGLCFVGKIRLKEFLEQKLKSKPGPIVTVEGKKLGQHHGLAFYTIGQRQGLGLAGGPWFIVKKDLSKNTLLVTNDPKDKALQTSEIQIHSVNWVSQPAKFPVKLKGRYRHQQELQALYVNKIKKGLYQVKFIKPQSAVASGQSLVMYDKNICVGGGVIV